MIEQNKLHVEARTVFETIESSDHHVLNRRVAVFDDEEGAARYVNLRERAEKAEADNARLRVGLDDAIGAYHMVRSMAHDYAQAGGDYGPEMRDWNEAERLILEAEKAFRDSAGGREKQ